jgi:hypothetical protein
MPLLLNCRNSALMSESEPLQEKITAGGQRAIAQAIERHRKLGEAIAVWQDGKVVFELVVVKR